MCVELCVSSKDTVNINKFLFEKYKQSLDCLAQDGVCAAMDDCALSEHKRREMVTIEGIAYTETIDPGGWQAE